MPEKEIETYCPGSRTDWRKWLEDNHQSAQSVWLVYYKSSTKVASISWSDAVDEALCFGWIDSTKKTIDKERYMQYFSRRKPKSIWSKINKEKVAKLIQNNLMTKAGFVCIETAKQNGSWTILDDVEALVMPEDLKKELANYQGSSEYFDSLSKSDKKILLHWVVFAKRTETRQKRILEIAACASKNLKPKQFR
ncbi:YdeI/OmpD-associated family protein [Catalinimonas niigatensis]|uniref:YdeI/OmpD-associated family protein n=1 Tax=Catalinimonas niigatensis TaxID=1397264 RepID=UPI0026660C6B|nr:YdeI/OmpD-associated family protein [Catalinimonas niigatensis]WPP50692.1 YdeI/OmpD-associated family protein [Catalinimonas niigatensis]